MKITYSIYLFIMLLIAGCNSSEQKTQTTTPNNTEEDELIKVTKTQFEHAKLKLGKADSTNFSEKLTAHGTIDVPPKNKASVSTFFEGYVSNTSLLIGDKVKKGDVLIELSNPEYLSIQQDYAENNAQLKYLASEYQRKKNLLADKVISQKVFEETRSLYKAAQAKDNALQKKITLMRLSHKQVLNGNFSESIKIYAPISGSISKMFVSQGSFVAKSAPIMEIINTEHVHLELKVFEKDIKYLSEGQTIEFQIPEVSDSIHKAYIRLIGAEIESDRSIKVHAHPENEANYFKVGMFVKAMFSVNTQKMLSLPEAAFTDLEGKTYVLRLKETQQDAYYFEKVTVENSLQHNGIKPFIPIDKTSPEDVFLVKGTFDLLSESSGGHSH
ncbi:cobalt-zinc-cadmium efflux system membrane fusion protein [Mesonia hippocampi]|uniref:Cobalt-zinc-cadmium efflux system membrane fusion protein n=1 Tax=Mesonia hippocampi TaxID=1628250 RepID=A0A840EJ41_9FLAO|nr:efflux RND transporter periplasmic adaptor subunit [Mesonia hippocampi]MBB4119372.1 cobalt-zinc-cadmium efflux system membrane fusion protein [Mesonia hippocampi]